MAVVSDLNDEDITMCKIDPMPYMLILINLTIHLLSLNSVGLLSMANHNSIALIRSELLSVIKIIAWPNKSMPFFFILFLMVVSDKTSLIILSCFMRNLKMETYMAISDNISGVTTNIKTSPARRSSFSSRDLGALYARRGSSIGLPRQMGSKSG